MPPPLPPRGRHRGRHDGGGHYSHDNNSNATAFSCEQHSSGAKTVLAHSMPPPPARPLALPSAPPPLLPYCGTRYSHQQEKKSAAPSSTQNAFSLKTLEHHTMNYLPCSESHTESNIIPSITRARLDAWPFRANAFRRAPKSPPPPGSYNITPIHYYVTPSSIIDNHQSMCFHASMSPFAQHGVQGNFDNHETENNFREEVGWLVCVQQYHSHSLSVLLRPPSVSILHPALTIYIYRWFSCYHERCALSGIESARGCVSFQRSAMT